MNVKAANKIVAAAIDLSTCFFMAYVVCCYKNFCYEIVDYVKTKYVPNFQHHFLNQNVHSKSVEDIIKIISEMIIWYR